MPTTLAILHEFADLIASHLPAWETTINKALESTITKHNLRSPPADSERATVDDAIDREVDEKFRHSER